MVEKIEELKKDIAELQTLEGQATRHKVKDILSLEIRKLSSEIVKLQEEINTAKNLPSSTTTPNPVKHYQVKLNNYAWDQTSKYVKFYVSLSRVQSIPQENVTCNFTNRSLELVIKNLENKDYVFTINNLLKAINPAESSWKVKTDMILIIAAKVSNENWSYVTELEKKAFDAQSSKYKPDDSLDPENGLMSLMKNMYDKGDDEMKRTIAKCWAESQNKGSVIP